MPYIVTAPLVITKNENGSDRYLYENALLPDDASQKEIDRLVTLGMVAKVSDKQAEAADAPVAESNSETPS